MRFDKLFLALAVLLLTGSLSSAQGRKPLDREEERQYLVSSRPGIVNLVEGDVTYKRGVAEYTRLNAREELQAGDTIRSGPDGRAEVLLMPGAYLRLAHDTEFNLADSSPESLKIALLKGSAIVEATTPDDWKGTLVTISTPKEDLSIVRDGIYRFNIREDVHAEVLVFKGKILAGTTEVKEGKKAAIEGSVPVVSSFDKKQNDSFDLWSKERAQLLVAANKEIPKKSVGSAFANSYFYSPDYLYGGGYSWFGSSWFFNPFSGFYTFLPGDFGFYSPYGFSYGFFYPYAYYWVPSYRIGHPGSRPGTVVGGTGRATARSASRRSISSSSASVGHSSVHSSGGGRRH